MTHTVQTGLCDEEGYVRGRGVGGGTAIKNWTLSRVTAGPVVCRRVGPKTYEMVWRQ